MHGNNKVYLPSWWVTNCLRTNSKLLTGALDWSLICRFRPPSFAPHPTPFPFSLGFRVNFWETEHSCGTRIHARVLAHARVRMSRWWARKTVSRQKSAAKKSTLWNWGEKTNWNLTLLSCNTVLEEKEKPVHGTVLRCVCKWMVVIIIPFVLPKSS